MENEQELDQFVDKVAIGIAERRLATPVVLFLELHKPLLGIAHAAGEAFSPLLSVLISKETRGRILSILESRQRVEQLISRVEFHSGSKA